MDSSFWPFVLRLLYCVFSTLKARWEFSFHALMSSSVYQYVSLQPFHFVLVPSAVLEIWTNHHVFATLMNYPLPAVTEFFPSFELAAHFLWLLFLSARCNSSPRSLNCTLSCTFRRAQVFVLEMLNPKWFHIWKRYTIDSTFLSFRNPLCSHRLIALLHI